MIKRLLQKNKEYYYFIVARLVGLAIKPLLLILMMDFGAKNEASLLAATFLVLTSVFMIYHIPFHYDYYKLSFEKKLGLISLRRSLTQYLNSLYIHVLLILPLAYIIVRLVVSNQHVVLLLIFALLIEKSFDEVQRYLLFASKFKKWSIIFLAKTLIPGFVAIIFVYNRSFYTVQAYIISGMICTISIVWLSTPRVIIKLLFKESLRFNWGAIKRYFYLMKIRYFVRFFQGVSRGNIQNADKWAAALFFPKLFLTQLVLMGQFGSGIVVGMNYITIANRRSALLSSQNKFKTVTMGSRLFIYAVILSISILVLLFSLNFVYDKLSNFGVILITCFILAYAVFTISEPFSEYLFWNMSAFPLVMIDMFYYIGIFSTAIFLVSTKHFTAIPVVSLVGQTIRCIVLMFIAVKVMK